MSLKNENELLRESEEDEKITANWNNNLIKKQISDLFSKELSGDSYKKYSIEQMKQMLEEKLIITKDTRFESESLMLLRKMKKINTIKEFLIKLDNYLFD